MNTKATEILRKFSKCFNLLLGIICVHFISMITYDILIFKRDFFEMISTYVILCVSIPIFFFGAFLVLYVDLKFVKVSERVLNLYSIIPLTFFGLCSVILGVEYYFEGFFLMSFFAPSAFLGTLYFQKYRFNKFKS